jgi:hypothetical protein
MTRLSEQTKSTILKKSITEKLKFWNDPLSCPICNEEYLHHGAVHVYVRDEEDALTGTISTVNKTGSCTTDSDVSMVKNPSRRRDGISIDMLCEHCGPVGQFTISQHKGNTIFGWTN